MIDIVDEKYGRIIIYDREDNPINFDKYLFNLRNKNSKYHVDLETLIGLSINKVYKTNLIILRNKERNEIVAIKNRGINVAKDILMNYGLKEIKKEKFEPIKSRFDILDL